MMEINNMSIAIVILHYNDYELTRQYIRNLEKQCWDNISYKYIVVDNASPDGSGKKLFEYYKDNEKVDVIILNENVGFSKGNNIGIKRAVDIYNPALIIVSNNDIEIPDFTFMQKLTCLYKEINFDVMGPDIYSTRREFHQSPIREQHLSIDELEKLMKKNKRLLYILKVIDKIKVYNLISHIKRKIKGEFQNCKGYDKRQEGVVLQGAFFVLSRGYLEAYPDGLYPETFLYLEEDILDFRVKKKHLKSVYIPDLSVLHFEGVSSIKKHKNNRCKKYIYELEQTNLSCKVMIQYLKET